MKIKLQSISILGLLFFDYCFCSLIQYNRSSRANSIIDIMISEQREEIFLNFALYYGIISVLITSSGSRTISPSEQMTLSFSSPL